MRSVKKGHVRDVMADILQCKPTKRRTPKVKNPHKVVSIIYQSPIGAHQSMLLLISTFNNTSAGRAVRSKTISTCTDLYDRRQDNHKSARILTISA